MKRTRFLAASLALVLGMTVEAWPQAATSQASDPSEQLMRTLQSTIVDATYERIDLEKIIEDLRSRYGLNIHISWAELEAAGVRRDQRIEVRLNQVPLSTVLDMVLRESGATKELTYGVERGVLVIGTRERTRLTTVLRVYDVTDLIESGYELRRFANTPVLGLETTGREFMGGEALERAGGIGSGRGGGGGGGILGDPEVSSSRLSSMERVAALIDLLVENIDPDAWSMNGGDVATMNYHDGRLIIRHTVQGHQRVTEFLEMIRSSQPRPLDAEVAMIRVRTDKAHELRARLGERFPRLSGEEASALIADGGPENLVMRASTSGSSGSRMWLSALTQRDVLETMRPTVNAGVVSFMPAEKPVTSGMELILLPLLRPESTALTLDVQMAWIPSVTVNERSVALGTGVGEATIDQAQRSMRTVSATVDMEVGGAIVLSVPQVTGEATASAEWEEWLIVQVGAAQQ